MPYSAVALGCQPSVEFDFARANLLTAFDRAEVEEIRHHGLLDLVSLIPHQNHQTGVGFANLRVHQPTPTRITPITVIRCDSSVRCRDPPTHDPTRHSGVGRADCARSSTLLSPHSRPIATSRLRP